MLALRRAIVIVVLSVSVAAPAAAQEAWFGEMPTEQAVNDATAGTDPVDVAARRWVAYNNLFNTTVALIGDRYAAGEMTDAERGLRDGYLGRRDRVQADLIASLPDDQREFYAGTQFAAWSALRDQYIGDRAFNTALLETFFSANFRESNGAILTEEWLTFTSLGLTPTVKPTITSQLAQGPYALLLVGLIAFLIPILVKRATLSVDRKNPFRLRLGGTNYELQAVTGVVENSSKMSTTTVSSRGGGGWITEHGASFDPVVITSETTIHDQWFIRQADGRVQTVRLSGWNFPTGDGHRMTALMAVRNRASTGNWFVIADHTTGDRAFDNVFLERHLMRLSGFALWLIQLALVAAVAFAATRLVPSLSVQEAAIAAVVGAFLGSVVWHFGIRSRFVPRFRRSGLRQVYAEVDRVGQAAAATA